jgi:hypothetical protein
MSIRELDLTAAIFPCQVKILVHLRRSRPISAPSEAGPLQTNRLQTLLAEYPWTAWHLIVCRSESAISGCLEKLLTLSLLRSTMLPLN